METITRKTMLYPTKVEYGDYCINHVLGCVHNCAFCYAFSAKYRWQQVKSRQEWCEPKLVANTLDILAKEIPKLMGKIKRVQLCFSTDPFQMGYEDITKMSIDVITMLNNAGIPCSTLTKGILPYELSYLSKENWHGITLVSLSEEYRQKYEPGSATAHERLNSLKALKAAGCKVWVSVEPYPTPNMVMQSLDELLEEISFVDYIVFGRCNYFKEATSFPGHKDFYNQCAREVIRFCEDRGISYHIKDGTLTA